MTLRQIVASDICQNTDHINMVYLTPAFFFATCAERRSPPTGTGGGQLAVGYTAYIRPKLELNHPAPRQALPAPFKGGE